MHTYVEATIRFLGTYQGKPVFFGRRRERDNLPLEAHTVRIENLRPHAGNLSLDREGLELVQHTSRLRNPFVPEERRSYLREIESLVRELTGARTVVAFGNGVVRRSERSSGFGEAGTTVPGRFAHCDFSSGPRVSRYWVEQLLPPERASALLLRRFAIYHVWRVLSDPPQDTPLALCDARSVHPGDGVPADQVIDSEDMPEQRIENAVFHYSPAQRWGYFPNMSRDEVLVFKGYESDPSRAAGVPHAAFDDSLCPTDAPRRESLDERVLAFF